jgi:PKD repeat protein
VGWLWDFGDGSASTERNPTHVDLLPGEYEVRLVVTDDQRERSAPSHESIAVDANVPPEADFRASPRGGAAPLAVTFLDFSSDADGSVAAHVWDVGDGTRSDEANPIHLDSVPGEYLVTLFVIDDQGARSERPKRDTILVE